MFREWYIPWILQEKLGKILFSELVVIHNVSETVTINIYNDWDIPASENHQIRTYQDSWFGFSK